MSKPKRVLFPQPPSHGNILSFTPPGFNQRLNVRFPDCRLAVCEKCKKNYKTRDMCRVRNNHTDPPWSTAYIAITLDKSCTDANGKYVKKPYSIRMTQWEPYCTKKPFDSKTPVCAACKKTNRTRSFCRERHQHRQLPWCTVYVVLSVEDDKDVKILDAKSASNTEGEESKIQQEKASDNNIPTAKIQSEDSRNSIKSEEFTSVGTQDNQDIKSSSIAKDGNTPTTENDDINNIHETRTFLCQVSCKASSIQWLELADADNMKSSMFGAAGIGLNGSASNLGVMVGMPGSMNTAQYYTAIASTPGFAQHQQQQRALKAQQQQYFEMQQRQQQQFVAQQVALQAQYNQQVQMVINPGQQGTPVTGTPAQVQFVPTSAVQPAAPLTSPGTVVSMPAVPLLPAQKIIANPAPLSQASQASSTQTGAQAPTYAVKDDAKATNQESMQQQAQAQWQMLYQQQLYQMQMQQQGHTAPIMIQPTGAMMAQQFVPGAVPAQQAVASPQFQHVQAIPAMQFGQMMPQQHLPPGTNLMTIQPMQQVVGATTATPSAPVVVPNQESKEVDENGKRKQSESGKFDRACNGASASESSKKPKVETA